MFNVMAEKILGIMNYQSGCNSFYGTNAVQSDSDAVEYWTSAAKVGHAQAQCSLAYMYLNGRGTSKNVQIASEWYQKAAEQGDAAAQYSLAILYENGRGVAQDKQKAIYWYQKAADQNYSDAAIKLKNLQTTDYHPLYPKIALQGSSQQIDVQDKKELKNSLDNSYYGMTKALTEMTLSSGQNQTNNAKNSQNNSKIPKRQKSYNEMKQERQAKRLEKLKKFQANTSKIAPNRYSSQRKQDLTNFNDGNQSISQIKSKVSEKEFEQRSKKYEDRIEGIKRGLKLLKDWQKRGDSTAPVPSLETLYDIDRTIQDEEFERDPIPINEAISGYQDNLVKLENEYQNYQEKFEQQAESDYQDAYDSSTDNYSQADYSDLNKQGSSDSWGRQGSSDDWGKLSKSQGWSSQSIYGTNTSSKSSGYNNPSSQSHKHGTYCACGGLHKGDPGYDDENVHAYKHGKK